MIEPILSQMDPTREQRENLTANPVMTRISSAKLSFKGDPQNMRSAIVLYIRETERERERFGDSEKERIVEEDAEKPESKSFRGAINL